MICLNTSKSADPPASVMARVRGGAHQGCTPCREEIELVDEPGVQMAVQVWLTERAERPVDAEDFTGARVVVERERWNGLQKLSRNVREIWSSRDSYCGIP